MQGSSEKNPAMNIQTIRRIPKERRCCLAPQTKLLVFTLITIPFALSYSFEAVLKDGLPVFENSRHFVAEASKLISLKIYFQTNLLFRAVT